MIQFNLLPSVKQEYIKTQRIKRLVVSVSFIASAVALGILVISLFSVYIVQRKAINDLNDSVKQYSTTLKNTPHVSDILTVQSQLNSLSRLNGQKPVASRLFGYLSQLTPTQATISDLHVDFALKSLSISGNAPSFEIVNTFVDGLKFTNYSVAGSTASKPAFSGVVTSSFSRNAKTATYTITMSFDPTIFDVANDVQLSVGSQQQNLTQQPSIIFKKADQ